MKKLIGITALLVMGTQPVFADDFGGHWVGTGKVSGIPGLNSDCTKIEITMEQSPGKLVTQNYHASCGLIDSNWGPDTMEIQGSKVFDGGDEIGTLTSDTLTTDQTEGTAAYTFNLKLGPVGPSGKRTLHSTYATHNDVGAVTIEGDLQEQ